jgi:hypothetical protein
MPAPTLTAYASPSDLQTYYDWREIGEVCTDSQEQVSANDQQTNPNIIRALNRGAGEIEANLMVSGMYSITDLQGLTGNSKELLIGMNCDFCICFLFERKPFYNAEKLSTYRAVREDWAKKLATGVNVFNIAAQIQAGTPEVSGLSCVQYAQSGLVPYRPGMHYFPVQRGVFQNSSGISTGNCGCD